MASMLFCAIALSVMGMLPVYFDSLEKQKHRQTAVLIATRAMDRAVDALADSPTATLPNDRLEVKSTIGGIDTSLTYTVAFQIGPHESVLNLKRVIVTVTYNEKGRTASDDPVKVEFETLVVTEG